MRVIGGTARGRLLQSPKGNRIRPTSDRVKEALFNIITSRVNEARVLDLFAGTGSLGIEALSRGAAWAVFVDWDWDSIRLIRKNLELTGLSARAEVYRQDVLQALPLLQRKGKSFDLIFLDPPYREEKGKMVLEQLAQRKLLVPGGMAVVEHGCREVLAAEIADLCLWRQRQYGDTVLSLYCRAGGISSLREGL